MKKAIILIAASILLFAVAQAFTVPYEGMTFITSTDGQITCSDQTTDTWSQNNVFEYSEVSEDIYEVEQPSGEIIEYNIEDREVLDKNSEGLKTSHWIPSDVSIGDEINIQNLTLTVLSENTEIETEFGDLEAIKLETERDLDDAVSRDLDDETLRDTRYYHKETGLFLKRESVGHYLSPGLYTTYSCEYREVRKLEDSGKDFNDNGNSNLEEVLVENKNPWKVKMALDIDLDKSNVKQYKEVEITVLSNEEETEAQIYLNEERVGEGSSLSLELEEPGENKIEARKDAEEIDNLIYEYGSDSVEVNVEELGLFENILRILKGVF